MKRAFLAATALAVLACNAKQQEADERQRVSVAIDALRAVPAEDVEGRIARADELAKIQVKSPAAARARDACATAYHALADSARLAAEASAGLQPSSHADPARTIQAAKDAIAAEETSEVAMATCSDASATLRLGP